MLFWSLLFLFVALLAALFGFGAIGGVSLLMAQILFWIFLVIFVGSLVLSFTGRRPRIH